MVASAKESRALVAVLVVAIVTTLCKLLTSGVICLHSIM